MASTAKVLSSFQPTSAVPSLRPVPAPAQARPTRWGALQVLRDSIGGALLLAAWLVLWTVTWAAIAGPLSPARDADAVRAQAAAVERAP